MPPDFSTGVTWFGLRFALAVVLQEIIAGVEWIAAQVARVYNWVIKPLCKS